MKTFNAKFSLIIFLLFSIIGVNRIYAREQSDTIQNRLEETLQEVVITSSKPLIKTDGVKTSYNLDANPASKTSSVIDMLKKMPSVTVDGENNIRLNGQSNFKIYVDGHEEPSLSANASTILKVMPASALSNIEVLLEPGAKYDAEGVGGIINLITQRKIKTDGYQGNVSLIISNRTQSLNGYTRIKKNKFTSSISATYLNNFFDKQKVNLYSERTNYFDIDNYLIKQNAEQIVKFEYVDINLNTSFELDTKNLFTASAKFSSMNNSSDNNLYQSYYYNKEGKFTGNQFYLKDLSMKQLSTNAQASFQHTFDSPGHQLVLNYLFNFNKTPLEIITKDIDNINSTTPKSIIYNYLTPFTREHTAQVDYINPFKGSKHLLETGAKAIFRINTSFTKEYLENPTFLTSSSLSDSDLTQFQNIGAIYAAYTGKYNYLTIKAGIRDEITNMGIKYHENLFNNFSTTFNDLVPDASLTWSFSQLSNIRLGYQMRISRPTVNQIIPHSISIIPGYEYIGNPDLSSEKNNSVSLSYSNFEHPLSGSFSVSYSATSNMIANYSYLENDIVYQIIDNIGKGNITTVGGFINWKINNKLSANFNGNLHYTYLDGGPLEIHNSGWSGNWAAGINYIAPNKLHFSASGGQGLNMISLQGHTKGWYYYTINASRSFLKNDCLTLNISASNFLTTNQIIWNYTKTPEYEITNRVCNSSWNLSLGISWSFGSLSSDVRKTSKKIENSDISTVSNKISL